MYDFLHVQCVMKAFQRKGLDICIIKVVFYQMQKYWTRIITPLTLKTWRQQTCLSRIRGYEFCT